MLIRGNKQKKIGHISTLKQSHQLYICKIKLPDMSERFRQRLYDGA